MMTDPIADMLTRIRNANQRKHTDVNVPFSKLKLNILNLLKEEGYVQSLKQTEDKRTIIVTLKYKEKKRTITGLKRISKPGLRVYSNNDDLPHVLNGLGLAIISTSKGIMSDHNARKNNLGGEVIAYVW